MIIYDMKDIYCINIEINYIVNIVIIEMDSENYETISNFEDMIDPDDDIDELRCISVSTG
ncbi:MAG: hypothetical protein H8E57_08705 [Candidatus Cloacimonetes bacterium]|nr:hypothetical protein [Candidatus Cloacimonadota bacterium]